MERRKIWNNFFCRLWKFFVICVNQKKCEDTALVCCNGLSHQPFLTTLDIYLKSTQTHQASTAIKQSIKKKEQIPKKRVFLLVSLWRHFVSPIKNAYNIVKYNREIPSLYTDSVPTLHTALVVRSPWTNHMYPYNIQRTRYQNSEPNRRKELKKKQQQHTLAHSEYAFYSHHSVGLCVWQCLKALSSMLYITSFLYTQTIRMVFYACSLYGVRFATVSYRFLLCRLFRFYERPFFPLDKLNWINENQKK